MRLKNKVVIVTGGGGGIGTGVAQAMAQEGAAVCIADVETLDSDLNQFQNKTLGGYTAAKNLSKQLVKEGLKATAIEVDVTQWDMVTTMVEKAVEAYGRVDILVNAAGVITAGGEAAELSIEDWDVVMTVNAKGTFLTNKAVIPQMRRQRKGKIINFASVAGKMGAQFLSHYAASKGAVLAFSNTLALELAKENITVNCVCPGIVPTQMWKLVGSAFGGGPGEIAEEFRRNVVEMTVPMGIDILPEDLAEAVIYLATADHVTRQSLNVDGGTSY